MQLLDILTILLFVLGIVIIGLSFSNKGRNMKSFFAAGGALPWSMSGLSLFMGFFSAGTFVVWGSIAYSLGWIAVSIQWTMAIAGFLVGYFIAPRWHNTGTLTVAEYIACRLGVYTQKVYTYLFLFISLFTTGSFLYPVAKIVEVSTGIPLELCIVLLGGFCILYVATGGLWAVVSTDVLQFVILTGAVLIVVPLALGRIGGIMGLIESAPSGFFNLVNGEYSIGFIIAFGVYNAIFLGGNWAYVQRYASVASPSDARKVGFLFGGLYVISAVLWMLPPMIYRIVNSSLSGGEAEGAYLMMCKEVLPAGLLGLMLSGMIFATASSLNATLNISSGVVTNDVFKRIFPQSSDKVLMKVARASTIVFGLLAIVVALLIPMMGGIVNVVISVAALTGVPLYLPVMWTLFSKRQTEYSVIITTIVSLGINAFFKFITPLWGFRLNRAEEMIVGVVFPVFCLIAFELYYIWTHKISNRYVEYRKWEEESKYLKGIEREEDKAMVEVDNRFSKKVLSYGIFLTGIAIAALGALANEGKGLVIAVGIVLVVLALWLFPNKKSEK